MKLKKLLNEISTEGGAISTHRGSAVMGIDKVFAGGFKPDEGEIKKLLYKQVEERKKKVKDTNSEEPNPFGGHYKAETQFATLAYQEILAKMEADKKYSMENTPIQDDNWYPSQQKIKFDDIYKHIDNEDDFINKSEKNMKYVGKNLKYDDSVHKSEFKKVEYDTEPDYYAGDNFINKSATNWEYINLGDD